MTETPKTPDQIKDERRHQIAIHRERRIKEFAGLLRASLKDDGIELASLDYELKWGNGPKAIIHNKGHHDIKAHEWHEQIVFYVDSLCGDWGSHDHYGDALIAAEIKPSWLSRLFGKGGAK